MAIDGLEWDAPDTPGNAAGFGYPGGGDDRAAFPKVRVVTVSECGSHAVADAEIGDRGQGQRGAVAGPPVVPARNANTRSSEAERPVLDRSCRSAV